MIFRAGNSFGSSCREEGRRCEDDLYRSVDGSCNNLAHSDWGAAGRLLLRSGYICCFVTSP